MKHLLKKLSFRAIKTPEEKEANIEQETQAYLTKITKDDSRKERREKLKLSFDRNNVIMKVTKEDILMEQDDEADEADLYQGTLILPRSEEQSPTVPNCCIICLDSYEPDDTVVWSSNPECQHAFHRVCIVKYLVKIQRKVATTPCPCCRSKFTDLEVEKVRSKRRRRRVSPGVDLQLPSISSLFSTSFRISRGSRPPAEQEE